MRAPKHHAGLFASRHERAYAKALKRLRRNDIANADRLLDDAIASDTAHEAVAVHLIRAIVHYKSGELEPAITDLEAIVSAHVHPEEDQLLHRYEIPPGYKQFDVQIGQIGAGEGTDGLGPVYPKMQSLKVTPPNVVRAVRFSPTSLKPERLCNHEVHPVVSGTTGQEG